MTQAHYHLPPAQLWIGHHTTLIAHMHSMLQNYFCTNNACATCVICVMIREHQHPSLLVITPEKSYTRQTLDPVFQTIAYQRDTESPFFIVLAHSDTMNSSCANSLLKSLEEPPAGYHFILLSRTRDAVIPTIRSRCIVKSFETQGSSAASQDIKDYFTGNKKRDALLALKDFETHKISEQESLELLDELCAYWAYEFHVASRTTHEKLIEKNKHILTLFKNALDQPPMPGSSKLFWKNLYMQFDIIVSLQ